MTKKATIEQVRAAVPHLRWERATGVRFPRFIAHANSDTHLEDELITLRVRPDIRVLSTGGHLGDQTDRAIDGDTLDERLAALPAAVLREVEELMDEAQHYTDAARELRGGDNG